MTEQSKQSLHKAFDYWWHNEGSGIIPYPWHDCEEHANRIARIAWHKGANAVTEAIYSALQQDPSKP